LRHPRLKHCLKSTISLSFILSAQRLAASKIETYRLQGQWFSFVYVLNALRHPRLKHACSNGDITAVQKCSTPCGIQDWNIYYKKKIMNRNN